MRAPYRNWWNCPKLNAYIEEQIGGEGAAADGGVITAIRKRIGKRTLGRGVSVGAAAAVKEMRLLAADVVGELDLFEISQERIKRGRRELERRGLASRATYFATSPLSWPVREQYDLVHWDHSLHHMSDVRGAVAWSWRALTPGGLLVVNDYYGPNRLQWTRQDAALANGFFAACRTDYGLHLRNVLPGNPISRIRMIMRDPSEAPQSELVMTACREVTGSEPAPIGGALLNVGAPHLLRVCDDYHPALDDMIRWDRDACARGHSHFAFGLWVKGES